MMRKKLSFLSLFLVFMILILASCGKKKNIQVVEMPTADTTTYTYTGSEITYQIAASELYSISNNVQTNAGSYEVVVRLNDKDNYKWSNDKTTDLTYTFVIYPKKIDKPSVTEKSYSYTGSEITFEIPTSNYYTISNNKKTEVGNYTATVSLKNKTNYAWADNSTTDLSYNFSIVYDDLNYATITGVEESYTYTGSAITPTPTVKLGTDTLTINDDYTVTYSNNTNAGTATINITGAGKYKGSITKTFSISKATPTVTATTAKESLVYTGSELELINAGSTTGGTLLYKLNDGEYKETIPSATNAGTYKIYYKVTGNENYNDVAEASIDVTIAKANPTCTAPNAISNLAYTGEAQALIEAGSATNGTLEYSLDGETYSETIPTATNAGTYKVYYKVVGNDNYNDLDASSIDVTIAKEASSITTAPEAIANLSYTGNALTLITAGEASGGTLKYSLDNETYSEDLPTVTNAGTYTIYYKIVGDENYSGTEVATVGVTVAKADATLVAPTAKALTYNTQAQELINAATTTGGTINYSLDGETYSEDIPTETNAGTYTIYYKVVGNDNYNDIAAATIEVTIAKLTPTVTAPTAKELTFTNSSQELINAGSTTGGSLVYSLTGNNDYSGVITKAVNAGTYTVYYKVTGDTNYNDVAASTIEVTIAKATPTVTAPSASDDLSYTCSAITLIKAGSTTGGTLQYSLDDSTYSTELPTGTDAGAYTVYYRVVGNDNYNSVDAQHIEVKIIKNKEIPTVTAPTAKESLVYTGSELELIDAGSTTGGTLLYKLNDGEYKETIPSATNAGTYTVYYKVEGNDGYTDVEAKSISVTIAKADSSVTTAPEAITGLSYTGSAQALVTAGEASDGTLKYSLDGATFTESIPSATNAGTYKVRYQVVGDSNHNNSAVSADIEVKIDKVNSSVTTAPTANNLTYTGSAQELITAGIASGGSLVYSLTGNDDYSGVIPTGTNAVSYTVYYKVVGDSNHNDTASSTVPVTIAKATPEFTTTPAAIKNLYQTGSAQALITAGEVTGGTLQYSLNNSNYSTEIPTATNAGDYTVYYKVVGNDNYNSISATSINVTISEKIPPTVTAPAAISGLTYNGSAQALITAGSTNGGTLQYSLDNSNYSTGIPTGTDARNYTVYYKVVGDDAYSDVAAKSIQVTISAKSITAATVTLEATEYAYTGSAIEPTVTSVVLDQVTLTLTTDYTVSYNSSAISMGNYTVTITGANNYTGTASANYTIVSQNKDIADATITLSATEFTFNNASQIPTITVTDGTDTLVLGTDYTLSYYNSVAGSGNTKTAGTITITVTGCGNKYSTSSTKTKDYVINKLTVTSPTITIPEATYTGSSISPTLTSVINGTVDITDQCSLASGSAKTNAGSYNVAIQFNSNNITTSETIYGTFTINPKPYTSLTIEDIDDVLYTGEALEPSVTIKDGNVTLVNGTSYDLAYSNNTNVGTATVTITFKGNYTGETNKTFKIVQGSYTITYMDGETELGTQNYHSSDTSVTLNSTSKDYYTGKWKVSTSTTYYEFGAEVTPATLGGNITLVAYWTPITYTITYELNGGTNSSNPSKYTVETPTITLANLEDRTGATFAGWYSDSEFTSENKVTEIAIGSHGNKTLYAKWTYEEYTITYNLNDGTNSSSNPSTYTLITPTITLADPTRDYYDFGGWYSDSEFTSGNKVTEIALGSTGAKTLYAKWTLHTYTITYNYNISSDVSNTNVTQYTLGTTNITLVKATAYKHQFNAWYSDSGYHNVITEIDVTAPSDKTIYGSFTKANTTLTKYLNGASESGTECGTISSNIDTTIVGGTVTATATVNDGYNFVGWFKDDATEAFTPELSFSFTLTTNTVVYIAKYTSYTLTYSSDNTDRGTVTATVSSSTISSGSKVSEDTVVTLTATTKTGYTFIGWFKDSSSTASATTLAYDYTMEAAAVTFVAKWIKVTITSNESTYGSITSLTSTYLSTDHPIVTATPNSGIIFAGWYNGETLVSSDAEYEITMPTEDTTYTAHFATNNITYSHYIIGYTYENSSYTISYTAATNITTTPTISISGTTLTYTMSANSSYLFAGWYSSLDTTNVTKTLIGDSISYTCEVSFDEDNAKTIYALWVEPTMTITKNPTSMSYTKSTYGLVTDGFTLTAADSTDTYAWTGWYNNDSPNYTIVDQTTVLAPVSGTTYYTLSGSTYIECSDLTEWAENTNYYIISPNTKNQSLTLSYADTYQSLVEQDSNFAGVSINYTAKWTQTGITVSVSNSNQGSASKTYVDSTSSYTITATANDGYAFNYWLLDGTEFDGNTSAEITGITATSGSYKAYFKPRTDMTYSVNYYLQNLTDDSYTLSTTYSYSLSNGVTGGTVSITRESSVEYYNFKEAYSSDSTSTIEPTSETTYSLSILADGTAHIDFYYDLKTVNITYHYNNGDTSEAITTKYDIDNVCYQLQTISNVTWYTDSNLTAANVVTSVPNKAEVWACYKGNNDLSTKFSYSGNSSITIEYISTVSGATIVFPDYINDIAVTTVIIDSIYGQDYSSVTMPTNLKLIKLGQYSGQIEWLILSSTSGTYKLLSTKILGSASFDETALNKYDTSTIKSYLERTSSNYNFTLKSTDSISLLTTEEYTNYIDIINNDYALAEWWLKDSVNVKDLDPESTDLIMAQYVTLGDDVVSYQTANVSLGVRPTITITL